MTDVSKTVVVAAYNDLQGASDAYEDLRQAKKAHVIEFDEAAILSKDDEAKITVKDLAERSVGSGAKVGAIVGGAIGILAGPVGWAALGGAAIGGFAAKIHDGGFRDKKLYEFGQALPAGASALITVADAIWVGPLEQRLALGGAKTVNSALKDDVLAQIQTGQMPAYTLNLLDSSLLVEAGPTEAVQTAEAAPTEFDTAGAVEAVPAENDPGQTGATASTEADSSETVEAAPAEVDPSEMVVPATIDEPAAEAKPSGNPGTSN